LVTVSCLRAITDVQIIEIPTLANNALGKHAFVCIVQTATKYCVCEMEYVTGCRVPPLSNV